MTRRLARIPLLWVVAWFAAAISARFLPAPAMRLERTLAAPAWAHLCGCDAFGRDMLFMVLRAAFSSSAISVVATVLGSLCALFLGGGIALLPGKTRFAALRALDAWLAFPFLLIALGWAAARGPGWSTLFFSLLIGLVPSFARLIYARMREIMEEPYIEAADSLGAGPIRILMRHAIPNLAPLVWVKAPILFSECLMAEAALSFLGVGAPVGSETWGSLLSSGKDYLLEAPHIAMAAGLPLFLTVLALQTLSSGKNPKFR